jgi:hypothetical protein
MPQELPDALSVSDKDKHITIGVLASQILHGLHKAAPTALSTIYFICISQRRPKRKRNSFQDISMRLSFREASGNTVCLRCSATIQRIDWRHC